MIIRSLVDYYEQLCKSKADEVPSYGWLSQPIHYFLMLSPDGRLRSIVPCGNEKHGLSAIVPQKLRGTSDGRANFLWDNALYLLGVNGDGQLEDDSKSFNKSKALHDEVLADCEGPVSKAIKSFYAYWNPAEKQLGSIPGFNDDVCCKGKFLAFCLDIGPDYTEAYADSEIKQCWDAWYSSNSDLPVMVSLVTGKAGPIALKHPMVKGIGGGTSKLISFNQEAFESYGRANQQGKNAPVDLISAHAYSSALNYLAASVEHRSRLGDVTALYWSSAITSDRLNCSVFSLAMGFAPADGIKSSEKGQLSEIKAVVEGLSKGKLVYDKAVALEDEFFLLGVDASSKGRLSVRFFLHDAFGEVMRHVANHYRITDICHAAFDPPIATPYRLLGSLENPNAKEPVISSQLSAPLMRSILQGARYPEALFQNALLRVRATKTVKREHAAIIRAYLIRNARMEEKEITVDVNPSNENEAYVLGRTFAVLEQIQEAANGKATIADRYLNAACSTPATTFPVLLKLSVAHLSKVSRDTPGRGVYLEKALGELMEMQQTSFPKRLSLIDQGSFLLGYYQQKQARYKKNDEQEA